VQSEFDKMVQGASGPEMADIVEPEEQSTGIQLANFSSTVTMDASDVQIPRLRLTQGLTQEVQDGNAKPGQWILTGFDPIDELKVIPIMFARNRNLRDEEGSILCHSNDAEVGEGEPGGVCDGCVMNQWKDGDKGKRVPPRCTFSYVYIVYIPLWSTMALVEFKRTSITAGKTLNTIVATRGIGNVAVKLRAAKQTGNKGTFYQAIVGPDHATPEELADARMYIRK
jgi:hypothetical protein